MVLISHLPQGQYGYNEHVKTSLKVQLPLSTFCQGASLIWTLL